MRRLILLLFLAVAAHADDRKLLDELDSFRPIHQVAISPDAKHFAWSDDTGVYLDGKRVTAKPEKRDLEERALDWSRDSSRLAFLSDVEKKGQRQLYTVAPGGTPKKLTSLSGYLASPQWSPDGKSIAFLFIENAKRAAGPLVAMSRDMGVVEEHIDEQRIAVLDVPTGKVRMVTPADRYVYEYDWSPDGTRIAAESAPGSGDDNYWVAQLHVVDLATGAFPSIYKPTWQIASPRWSADSRQIAFIEGLMSDQGSTGGDLFVVDAAGGTPRNLTPRTHFSVTTIDRIAADGITVGANIEGDSAIVRVSPAGDITTLWRGGELVTAEDLIGASFASDGTTSAVIRASNERPPEVWTGALGAWTQVSHVNDAIKSRPGQAKSIKWTSDDLNVQGWLLFPTDYDASKKYPMIVWVHGGPASSALNKWPYDLSAIATVLTRRGYFVFYPNPRGSYGQGEAFTQGNVKDFGYGDLRDIMSGVDKVLADYPVDANRLGLWGWSYGGYMTMWAVTQTQRFRAAVAGAGIVNWQSYYGQNDIDQWMLPYFGASVYDDPAVYAKSAPITYIKNVKTPTLILVGERDGEVPAPQSYEFWHALKTLGVPTRLVVYPDEGHRIANPEHKRDIVDRVVTWFGDYLK